VFDDNQQPTDADLYSLYALDGLKDQLLAFWDNTGEARKAQLEHSVSKFFDRRQPPREDSDTSRTTWQTATSRHSTAIGPQSQVYGQVPMNYQEQRLEHIATHEHLRNLAHEAFSPPRDPWAGWNTSGGDTPGYY